MFWFDYRLNIAYNSNAESSSKAVVLLVVFLGVRDCSCALYLELRFVLY